MSAALLLASWWAAETQSFSGVRLSSQTYNRKFSESRSVTRGMFMSSPAANNLTSLSESSE